MRNLSLGTAHRGQISMCRKRAPDPLWGHFLGGFPPILHKFSKIWGCNFGRFFCLLMQWVGKVGPYKITMG